MTWYDASMHQMAERLFSLDVSPLAYPIAFFAGLLTNVCPCNIAMLPIVLGGAGGFSFERERSRAMLYSAVFSAGIVVTLCSLGGLAALVGTTLLALRNVCLAAVALVSLAMGLYCLDIVRFTLPGFSTFTPGHRRGLWGTFALGLMAGVVASPCTTPVLAVILTYVAAQARLPYGVSLLFAYAVGFIVPLLLVGACADFILRLRKLDERTHFKTWIGKAAGAILIAFSLYLFGQMFIGH